MVCLRCGCFQPCFVRNHRNRQLLRCKDVDNSSLGLWRTTVYTWHILFSVGCSKGVWLTTPETVVSWRICSSCGLLLWTLENTMPIWWFRISNTHRNRLSNIEHRSDINEPRLFRSRIIHVTPPNVMMVYMIMCFFACLLSSVCPKPPKPPPPVDCCGLWTPVNTIFGGVEYWKIIEHRMSDIEYRTSETEYRYRISTTGVGYPISDTEYRIMNIQYRIPNIESNIGYRISDTEYRISNIGYRISNIDCRQSDTECRPSNIEYRMPQAALAMARELSHQVRVRSSFLKLKLKWLLCVDRGIILLGGLFSIMEPAYSSLPVGRKSEVKQKCLSHGEKMLMLQLLLLVARQT